MTTAFPSKQREKSFFKTAPRKDCSLRGRYDYEHNETRVEYMTLMMELKEQRREGYDEGKTEGRAEGRAEGRVEGRVENIVKNVRALMAKKGWSTDETFDVLNVSPEDRAVVTARL